MTVAERVDEGGWTGRDEHCGAGVDVAVDVKEWSCDRARYTLLVVSTKTVDVRVLSKDGSDERDEKC